MNAIEFNNVWEKYRIKFLTGGRVSWEEMWALEDVNLTVKKGQVLGIIGQNGAGKTTLLKLISGMLMPDKGAVNVYGRVSVLMELGAGFNPEFTGRENIALNARIYGLNEKALTVQLDKITEFAGLGKFIDAPIKYYSQGMYMRLAFALAIYVDPEILLIDDILSVGDEEAQRRCINKVFELRESGKTIVIVSHDMGMIQRLCDGLILLEKGKVLYSGEPIKVINRYLESVGDKDGVVVLNNEKIRVIFNNGRLMLAYDDLYITRGSAGFISFYLPGINHCFSSVNLDWNIIRHAENEITAEGANREGVILIKISLRLDGDKLEIQGLVTDGAVKDPCIDIMFAPEYEKWADMEKTYGFPEFAHKISWQRVGPDIFPGRILGMLPRHDSGLPGLIFKLDGKENVSTGLFNTGYEHAARIIRLRLHKNISLLEIGIHRLREEFINQIGILPDNFISELEREQGRALYTQSIASGDLLVKADSKNKSLRFYFRDIEISREIGGINTVFPLEDALNMNIQKVASDKLMLELYYDEPLCLSQIWILACLPGNMLDLRIEYELAKGLNMPNRDLHLALKRLYESWRTPQEEGGFSSGQYINNVLPVRLKYNKVSSVVFTSATQGIPDLYFEARSELNKRILGIYSLKEEEREFTCLNFSRITTKREEFLPAGRHTYFEGRISLGKGISFPKAEPVSCGEISLIHEDLQFIFDQGKSIILKGSKELTSGLGLYTSVRSSGVWYDSYQADWRVTHQQGNSITVEGYWPYIPISQIWELELINEGAISWKVEMEVFEEAVLEIQQANLMLSSRYRNWMVPGMIQGEFLNEYTSDYDIYPFRFWHGKANNGGIAVSAKDFPGLSFVYNFPEDSFRGIIENTDYLYKARLLQYQKANCGNLPPGKYACFEGLIKIG